MQMNETIQKKHGEIPQQKWKAQSLIVRMILEMTILPKDITLSYCYDLFAYVIWTITTYISLPLVELRKLFPPVQQSVCRR